MSRPSGLPRAPGRFLVLPDTTLANNGVRVRLERFAVSNPDHPLMTETLFSACNLFAALGWLLLIGFPNHRLTAKLVAPVLISGLLAVAYACLLVSQWGSTEGGFTSLEGVKTLFSDDRLLLAGWIHYLVLDLFVGSWEVRDSQRCGIRHAVTVPCLLGTFLFGPAGLLLYLMIRRHHTGVWRLSDSPECSDPFEKRPAESLDNR